MTVAVPAFLDPTTGQTTSATVALTVVQGNSGSAPISITVQDIPQASAYGTSLGRITRTFYNYEAMTIGAQLGVLRAAQASKGNTVDTTSLQTTAQASLAAITKARRDVDQLIANPTSAIPEGVVAGKQLSFNQTALQTEDRILGWYLVSSEPLFAPGTTFASVQQRLRTNAQRSTASIPNHANQHQVARSTRVASDHGIAVITRVSSTGSVRAFSRRRVQNLRIERSVM